MLTSAEPGYPLLILMYHAVVRVPLRVPDWCFLGASTFEQQMAVLKERCDVMRLGEAVTRLSRGFRRPTAAITFDDGFLNNYELAFPVLRALKLPATIFVCTDLVDTDGTLWFCRLNRALADTAHVALEWDGDRFDLCGREARAQTSAVLQGRLKILSPDAARRQLQAIISILDEDPDRALEGDSPYRMLTGDAIRVMQESGMIEIGAHSRSHAILSRLYGEDRREEIVGSVAAVRALTGQPCRLFAYPNGSSTDYDRECMDILRACGVEAAVTAMPGTNDSGTPLLELRRFGVGEDMTRERFMALLDDAPAGR